MDESGQDSCTSPQPPSLSPRATRTTVRRSHKKSRNGCRYCKQRRVKCDENKPTCGNCSRSFIVCDYTPKGSNAEPIVSRGRGRPRKDRAAITDATSQVLASPTPLPLYAPLHVPWGVDDMELFYHYLTVVAVDTGDDHLWKHQLPRIAFRYHTILHLLLAIAALHLARSSEPRRSAHLVARAEAHMDVGLRRATQDLSNLNEQNCAELYIVTTLICTYTFAKKPGPGNLLVVAEGHESAWWGLFRGVRVIVDRMGLPTILARLAHDADAGHDIVQQPSSNSPKPRTDNNPCKLISPSDWGSALQSLSDYIEQQHGDDGLSDRKKKRIYQDTFSMLKWCYHGTFGSNPHTAATPKFETIMAWLYVLTDDYVDLLKEGDPPALLLLAYFAVLLQTLETVWFLEGWALHILRGVREVLFVRRTSQEEEQEQWLQWLLWPQARVEEFSKMILKSTDVAGLGI